MGKATDILNRRKKYGSTYVNAEYDTTKSSTSASDILNNRRISKYREEINSMDIKSLYDYKDFGLSEDKKNEYKTTISKYKTALENLKKYDSSIKDEDYNSSLESINLLSDKFDLLSSFKSEDDYNKAVKEREQQEAWASADTEALKSEIADLEGKYNSYKSLKTERDNLFSTIVSGYMRAGYSRENAEKEALKSGKIVKYDKELSQYGDMSGMDSTLSEKNQFLNNATRIQEKIALQDNAKNAEDFDKYSKIGADFTNPTQREAEGWATIGGGVWGDNDNDGFHPGGKKVENIVKYSRDNAESIQLGGKGMVGNHLYKYLKDDEVQIYDYYLAKEKEGLVEKGTAQKYLDSMEETLNQREGGQIYEGLKDSWPLELAFGVSAGLDQWASGVKSLFNTDGEYVPQSSTQYASAAIREDLSEDYGMWGQGAYDLINTTANMAPSILLSKFTGGLLAGAGYVNAAGKLTKGAAAITKAVGAGTLGASAAGNGYQEMLNLGYDKNQAQAYGTLVGLSEAGLEYVLGGISSLGGTASGGITDAIVTKLISNVDKAIAKVAIGAGGKLIGSMISEFGEEYLQEVLDPVFKNITLNTDEDIKLFSSEAFYSGILGALSAGLLEGGSTISGEVATYKAGKDVKNTGQLSNLKKFGTSFSADTVAYKIASQVNENTDAYTIGQLLHEVGADSLSEANIADITKSLERKGIESGQAQTIAKWLNSAVMGEVFNPLQRLALKNPDITQTFKDVIINQNSTVNQRMQSYTDILQGIATEKETLKANKTNAKAEKKANSKPQTDKETKSTPFVPYSSEEIAKRQASGEVVVNSEGKSIADTEKALENKFEVNIEGKTVNVKSGEEVNVSEIASIDNGKMTLKLENGETVDAEDISFGTEDEGLIYSTVLDMGVNAAVANSLVKNYNPSDKLSAKQYAMGIKEVYKYGSYGMPMSEISKNGFAADLSEAQRTHAYNLGKADMAAKVEKAQKEVEKVTSGKGGFEGKVHFKGDSLALKEVQRESLKRMGVLSEVLGVDFHVFESYMQGKNRVFKDADGKIKKAPNGFYSDGKIYIDLNAGKDGQGVMIYTVAHELTHWIRDWSPAKFKVLADFLMEQYGKKGHNVNDLVQAQIAKAKRNGRTIDYDTAYEEVVADSMETMLSDDAVYEKILELKSKDASIVKKIGEFFAKIVDSFKKLMQQYPPETTEGKLVSEMYDSFSKLQELFAEALVDASDNYQANKGQKNTTSEGAVKESQRLGGYFPDISVSTKDIDVFGINDINNLKEVKHKVYNYLLGKYVSNDKISKPIKNIDTDMEIFVYKGGIDETFGNANAYKNLYTKKKKVKLATMTSLAKLIKYGEIRSPESSNTYNSKSQNTYAYLTAPITVDGVKYTVDMDIKKTQNGNRFYVHTIKIAGESPKSNDSSTKSSIHLHDDSISQTSKKSQEKLSGRENTIGERNLEDFAEAKDTEGKTLFQYRAMESDEDVYREMLKTANVMSDSEIDSLFDTIDRAMDIIKDNLEILDYAWDSDIDDRAFNPVKPNSDSLYQVSVDFSTLCRKRLLQQAIQVQLQEALNKPLTREEGIAIRDALITIQEEGRQIEVACALCYVESARMKSPAQIKKFLEIREKVLKEFFATKSGGSIKDKIKQAEIDVREKLHKDNPKGIKGKDGTMLDPRTAPLKAMPKKYADPIRDAKRAAKESYTPTTEEQKIIDVAKGMTISDFTSPEGLENLAKNYPQLFDAYTSYIRNATKSKGIEGDTWWRAGDSQSIGDTLIANMNAENGLRSQSWSDFQVIHLLDYMAATIELSTRKAKMQAYTKVPDFVELMGNTGEMINLSLIPTRNFNGTLEFDSVEGMAFEESLRLRDKYHATAGTIAIGIDDVQIQMLLADSKIDYVIPYHKSGMAASIRKLMHIPTWSQYEDYQSEKNISRDVAKKQAEKYGVKLLSESDSNYQKHPNFSDWFDITEARQIAKMENSNPSDKAMAKKYGVMYGGYKAMQNAANNYLKLCAERGISPKFSHENANFTTEDNYWKLLIDRKMIDNVTGEVIEQQAVKPIFDQGEVLRILNDELERYPGVKADQDYATRKVTENFLSGNIKGGMSAEAIAKAMKKPVDNVAKVNILASVEDSKLSDRDSYAPTFYSQMGKTIDEMKQDKIGANSVVSYLKGRGVKNEEIKWSGIETFLEGKKSVTKAELQEFVAGSMLQIEEETFGRDTFKDFYEAMSDAANIHITRQQFAKNLQESDGGYNKISELLEWTHVKEEKKQDVLAKYKIAIENFGKGEVAKYSDYKLDGGENYREITFKIPNSTYTNMAMKAHWGNDAKGILAHARIQDFDVDGKKMLFIEEIQSDWHNMGHKVGYKSDVSLNEVEKLREIESQISAIEDEMDAVEKERDAFLERYWAENLSDLEYNRESKKWQNREHDLRQKQQELYIERNKYKVKVDNAAPDAPFKDNYHEYVIKRLLRMAAEQGYDSIGWTPADVQSQRWSDEYAEGYRIEYDQDIPKFLKKYGKQWDATVGTTQIDTGISSEFDREMEAKGYIEIEPNYTEVWSMDITDSMKNSVLYEGQALYSDRDPDIAENIEKINKQLAKENVKLIEDVKYLKELVKLQSKETHGKMLKKSTVELVAKRLMTYSSAKGNISELVGYLTDVYNYIAQGEDVSWEGIQEKSQAAVDWLMQNEYHKPVREEYADNVLKHLRTMRVSLDDAQKAEVAHIYGSFNNFRKKNMGRIIITNDGISLDSAWQELAESYPMYFDKDTNSADQPILLMDIIDGLQNTYAEDEYHYYSNEMVAQDLMTKVYEGYWDVSALHTVADAKAKEINLLKAKHRESMDELRQTHAENEAKLRQEHKDKVSELRTKYREREETKMKKVAEYYQKSRKEAVDRVKEAREKRDAVTKLQRLVLDTAKWVSYPKKDDVKCPDILRSPYAEFLSSIDLSSKRMLNGGEPTQNDLRVSSAMDSLAKAIEKKLGTQSPDTETETVLDTGYLDLPVHFVENLKELSENLKKRMATDGHIVNSMTSEEVKELTKFIRTLNHSIKEMSTLYSNMRFAKVEQLGNDTMVFLKYLGEAKQTNSISNFVTWDNALPYYTFKRFGEAGESVFEELMDAQDKLAYLADGIFKFKEKTWTDKESSEWSKDTHTIKLPSGRELTLTSADAMSIYCLSRREQGRQHLLGGGVRVLGIEKNGKKANDSRSLLNLKDIEAIYSSLTERQKKVAEAIQEYMSTVCSEWGNEISMKRFLTKEFTEKFYFPIESNDENLDTKDPKAQQSDLYRLLNISATKPLTKGANNEVIIRNIFDVFTNHSSDMAKLNAYGMALLDYMKWINYREKTVNDDGQISVSGVRKSMERAYGPEAKKYIIGLIKDINGRANDGGDHPFLMKMTRMAKTAMVGANLRVSLLQFTAYPRAAMVLSNKSLALGLTKTPQIEKAKKYCGIALWKSFGFYDTNISRSIEDQIKGTTNVKQKLIELSLKGAEWGDAITWGCLWNACEYEVAKTKQYKVGSEEFNQAVGKKLRDVVYATQVVDSTLTRSQMMRNKSGLTQSASAFMSEPTLSANILMDAGFQFNLEKRRTGSNKLAWQKTGKYIGKAVAVYSIGQIIAALAEALADAYRDDDDEEFMAKFGEAFKENVISDLNPFNKIPIIADVSDLIMSWFGIGFSSSNSLYLQAVDEASNAFDIWSNVINGEGGETVYAGIYSTTKLISYITGVSASGAMREVVTLWNNTAGATDPYLKIRTYESSATDKGIAEYKFDKGDTTSVKNTVSKMIEDKVKSGKTQKESKSAVRASFTSTYKSEYMAAVKAKDYDEMNRIRKFLYATGLYGTLSELDETLKKWRTSE